MIKTSAELQKHMNELGDKAKDLLEYKTGGIFKPKGNPWESFGEHIINNPDFSRNLKVEAAFGMKINTMSNPVSEEGWTYENFSNQQWNTET